MEVIRMTVQGRGGREKEEITENI